MEKYIKKKLIDENVLKKNLFIFEKDTLLIFKNTDIKNPYQTVSYNKISCLHMLSSSSFYFKGGTKGFALFFKDFCRSDAKKWYGILKFLKGRYDRAEVGIQRFDIDEYFDCLEMKVEKKYFFKFDYFIK